MEEYDEESYQIRKLIQTSHILVGCEYENEIVTIDKVSNYVSHKELGELLSNEEISRIIIEERLCYNYIFMRKLFCVGDSFNTGYSNYRTFGRC